MLEIVKLTKDYGKLRALDEFTFTFGKGIYALLGPNGSGKSTLLELLTDNLKRTSGEILFNGRDITAAGREYRRMLGYMPQNAGMYPGFTCEEYMLYIAQLKDLTYKQAKEQTEQLLKAMELDDVKRNKTRTLSGGMRQRLALAQAFLGNPKLVILDEPTAGLDPSQRIAVRNFISLNAFEKTIIYATHVVSDIDAIANYCIFLKKGVIASCDTPQQIAEAARGSVWTIVCDKEAIEKISEGRILVNMRAEGKKAELRLISGERPTIDSIPVEPELQDAYLVEFGITAGDEK